MMDGKSSGAVERGASVVLAAAAGIPAADMLREELACAERATARGYFLPDEERLVRVRYAQYLSVRAALLEVLGELAAGAAGDDPRWERRLPEFVTAFAAACLLMRATRFIIGLAKDRSVVWKKLDEADTTSGIPRKSFTALYKAAASPTDLRRFIAASDFYFRHLDGIRALAADPSIGPVVVLLAEEEPSIERRRRDALKRLFSYRWFSFLRRHRSAWRQVMFGLFRISGSTIAELRQPGVKPSGAPKRITPELQAAILTKARAGDVFVTRHDDAVSNLFLPGFWPHAALYLGTAADLAALGLAVPPEMGEGHWFLEAKKDGVRIRPAEETLHVDACVVARPPFGSADVAVAVGRALGHAGKPFDFLFDFRNSDVLACTAVIYRGFHGTGGLELHLEEVGGRLCLPAEELLNQMTGSGFRIVAIAGVGGDRVVAGSKAEVVFHGHRVPL